MKDRRDFAIAALLLSFVLLQLVQCTAHKQDTAVSTNSSPTAARHIGDRDADEEREREADRRGDETQEEERAKIRGVARALQTIAANPEMQKTYGFKP